MIDPSLSHAGTCWNCGNTLSPLDYGRGDSCQKCGRDTRTCKGCTFFDLNAHNQCHETQADRVVEKERSNFCDYFKPSSKSQNNPVTKDSLKAAAEALFKKK